MMSLAYKNMWRYGRYNLSRTVLPSHIAEIMTISTDYIPRLNERSVTVGSHRYHIIYNNINMDVLDTISIYCTYQNIPRMLQYDITFRPTRPLLQQPEMATLL